MFGLGALKHTMLALVIITLVSTSHAYPDRDEDMIQRPSIAKLPDLNIEDLLQPTARELNDDYPDFPIKDPFADSKDYRNVIDFKDEDIVQRPLGGMPPHMTWCPGGIKKLCLKPEIKEARKARKRLERKRNRRSRGNKKTKEQRRLERKQARANRKSRSDRKGGRSKKKSGSRRRSGSKRRRKSKQIIEETS